MGRPSNKRPVVEPIRRKCATCGKVLLVKHRKWIIPQRGSEYKVPSYNPNTKKKERKEIPGVEVLNFCSIECGGEGFLNTYTEDDFIR